MAVFAIYIEKETNYFGSMKKFGNLYHVKTDPGQLMADQTAAQALHDAEKAISSPSVKFTGWQSYGPTDGPEFDNVMREDGTFSDQGFAAEEGAMYAEACMLVVWPLPRSPRTNRKRWLRKFVRLGVPTPSLSDAQVRAAAPLDNTQRQYVFDNYILPVTNVDGAAASTYELCTADGDTPDKPGEVRPYLYTRQIGQ